MPLFVPPGAGGGAFTGGMSNLGNTSGTTGVVRSQMVFAGGANITLSQSTNGESATITISAGGAGGAAGTNTIGGSNLGNTAGTSGVITGSAVQMVFAGGNNVTLSQSINGSSATITVSAFNQTVQTQNMVDVTLTGNTAGVMALVSSGTLTLAGGNNITLSQAGNAITISGPNTAAQSVESQSLGMSNLGNTSGTTGIASGGQVRFVLAGGNNVTLSQSLNGASGTITISAFSQTVQTQNLVDVTLTGNTAGVMALVSSGTLTLAGGNNITLSQAGNAITISGPNTAAQSVESQSFGMSNLGNTSGTTGIASGGQVRFILAGGNNVTLSQSINGASGTITISAGAAGGAAGTNTLGASNLGNTAGTSGVITGSQVQLVFAGGNNITLSQSINGSSATITVSAFNQSVQTQNMADVTLSGNTAGVMALVSSGTLTLAGGNNITLSQAGNAITISGPNTAAQSVESQSFGMSNIGNTSGTTGIASGGQVRFVFAGGNNVTLSQSLNGASGTITISAFNQSAQTQDLHDVTLAGNTSGALALISSGTMTLAGGNNITLSQAGNAITISAGAGVGGGAGTNTFGASNLGNTAGTSGVVTGSQVQLVFAGGNNVTLSQSINGSSATITISAFNQSIQTQSTYGGKAEIFNPYAAGNLITQTIGTGSVRYTPFYFPGYGEFSAIALPVHLVLSSSSNSSHAATFSFYAGIYTRNASTLSLASSASASFAYTNTSNNSYSALSGPRLLTAGLSLTLTPGNYWFARQIYSATQNVNWMSLSEYVATYQASSAFPALGVGSNATNQRELGLGIAQHSASALKASEGFAAISGQASSENKYLAPMFYNFTA